MYATADLASSLVATPLVTTGTDMAPWLIGGAVVLLLLGGGLLFMLRRRRD